MDFNRGKATINWLAKSRRPKACVATLVFACLLNCGCESEPISDSQSSPPAASKASDDSASDDSAPTDSTSVAKKSADVVSKKTEIDIPKPVAPPVPPKPPEPDVNDTQFHSAIKAAAEQYLQFAIVNTGSPDDPPAAQLAPVACRPASVVEEPAPRMSQADSESGHGQKLYFLFAKDIGHYLNPDDSKSPVGQVLVKESWTAVSGNPDARNLRNHSSGNRVNPRVTVDGETLKLGRRKDLFVMLKQDPKTEATDDGWVYGIIDPKSHEIKASGAVASCIACHEGENDRLFRAGIIDWYAKAKKMAESGVNPDEDTDLLKKSPADPEDDSKADPEDDSEADPDDDSEDDE